MPVFFPDVAAGGTISRSLSTSTLPEQRRQLRQVNPTDTVHTCGPPLRTVRGQHAKEQRDGHIRPVLDQQAGGIESPRPVAAVWPNLAPKLTCNAPAWARPSGSWEDNRPDRKRCRTVSGLARSSSVGCALPRLVSVRLLDVFGAGARATKLISTMGVGRPRFLVVAGVLLIICMLDGAFRVWLFHAELS